MPPSFCSPGFGPSRSRSLSGGRGRGRNPFGDGGGRGRGAPWDRHLQDSGSGWGRMSPDQSLPPPPPMGGQDTPEVGRLPPLGRSRRSRSDSSQHRARSSPRAKQPSVGDESLPPPPPRPSSPQCTQLPPPPQQPPSLATASWALASPRHTTSPANPSLPDVFAATASTAAAVSAADAQPALPPGFVSPTLHSLDSDLASPPSVSDATVGDSAPKRRRLGWGQGLARLRGSSGGKQQQQQKQSGNEAAASSAGHATTTDAAQPNGLPPAADAVTADAGALAKQAGVLVTEEPVLPFKLEIITSMEKVRRRAPCANSDRRHCSDWGCEFRSASLLHAAETAGRAQAEANSSM